jgi:hypothetical protein
MTYEESAALMIDMTFRGRVKVAVLKYADFIMNESPGVTAHNARVRWAAQTYQQPDRTAQETQPPAVMDSNVQTHGANVTDELLQSAVEATVNKLI